MINEKELLKEAKELRQELIEKRRYLHMNAEVGFNLTKTLEFVKSELISMGYEPIHCGKSGLIVVVGGKKPGKTFLIRGDMDALPIKEEAELEFASKNGCMHACGHDMHTTMMLGAAKLLKKHEDEINGTIKLMFQPAEEIFEGSNDMIENGLLENPKVAAALMIHVMSNSPFKTGTAIVSAPGVSAPAADYFKIKVQGMGCHGSMPNTGVDPIVVSAHILIALQEINSRELAITDKAALTVGTIQAGKADNAIPDTAIMGGTIRTYDEETRIYIKNRMSEIAQNIANAFRAKAEVIFGSGCPTLVNDANLCKCAEKYTEELLEKDMAFSVEKLNSISGKTQSSKSAGSEDFAYVSHKVPSIMIALAAGQAENGYSYPGHHPKVKFDEDALPFGSCVYAYIAMRWLMEH